MRVQITSDGIKPATISWAEFARENADIGDFGEPSIDEIEQRLRAGETVNLGGGAAPLFTLKPIHAQVAVWALPYTGDVAPIGCYALDEASSLIGLTPGTIEQRLAGRCWFNTDRHHVELIAGTFES